MLDAMLSIGGWALVGALIYFSERWAEREREFFGHGDVQWGRFEQPAARAADSRGPQTTSSRFAALALGSVRRHHKVVLHPV